MNFFNKAVNRFFNRSPTVTGVQLITERGNGFYSWNGDLYKSDIIRSCVRPFYKSIGKLTAKHIRQTADGLKVNPDAYVKMLLEEPNPYMTGQMLQEKLATTLTLNNNAFAFINRDQYGYATEIYPIPAVFAEAIYDKQYQLYFKFTLLNGKTAIFSYGDIIHLRQDYNTNDIFGESNAQALTSLMEIINTIDQGVVKAIKNSAVIKWLLKFNQPLKPKDLRDNVEQFVSSFLHIDTKGDNMSGAAATDAKFDAEQVKPNDYVPNASQMDKTVQRIYNYFATNEKIIQSKFTEDEWNAYYEATLEPIAIQMSNEFTRKIFSRRERGFGNRIIFESNSLQYASMSTKLGLLQMVDRGAMTPNEWRLVLNMGPIEGGDKPVRRLDTAEVGGDNSNGKNTNKWRNYPKRR